MSKRFVLCLIVIMLILAQPGAKNPASAQTELDLERLQRATVLVMQARNLGDELAITCVGSGTIVSRDGLVLANAHDTLQSSDCPGDTLLIGMSIRQDEPPVLKYRAAVIQSAAGLDLALLRITQQLDGRQIEQDTLTLPFVELGDSSVTQLDETITVVGYPGIGSDTVITTRGTISGFTAEPGSGGKSWIKTSASIPGTMSGGGAYNQQGQLIGIPTTAPLGARGDGACQAIQDTNRDGLVDSNDICIPLGSFINALRPSNFARPLLRAAGLSLTVDVLSNDSTEIFAVEAPSIRRLFFSPSVNEAGMPTSVISSLPTGSTSLHLFFDYLNMTPTTVYELRTTTDGIPNSTFSLAPVRWSGGSSGMWYIGSSDQPWPNGIYEFTLFTDGVTAGVARITIGGGAEPASTFSDIVFGLLDLQNNVLGNGYVLPTGNIASARFIYRNMMNGTPWAALWYYEGVEVFRSEDVWQDGDAGSKEISIQDPQGLLPGKYRLELYIEGRLASTADFTMGGAQQGVFPQMFSNAHFTTADSSQEATTTAAISSFPNTVPTMYALFDWQQIATGTLWTMRWRVDNEIFFELTTPWDNSDSGSNYLVQLNSAGTVPDGTYSMELLVNNILIASAQAQVGIGQLPIDRFAQASGVQVRGRIIDADTREGIPGVTFIIISKDFSVEEFTWDESQTYTQATTDRNGQFQLNRLLAPDDPYSVIIAAEGYLPISADGFTVTQETENPLELTIYLTRD